MLRGHDNETSTVDVGLVMSWVLVSRREEYLPLYSFFLAQVTYCRLWAVVWICVRQSCRPMASVADNILVVLETEQEWGSVNKLRACIDTDIPAHVIWNYCTSVCLDVEEAATSAALSMIPVWANSPAKTIAYMLFRLWMLVLKSTRFWTSTAAQEQWSKLMQIRCP